MQICADFNTGANWAIAGDDSTGYTFHCLGDVYNSAYIFLNGGTSSGTVNLVSNTGSEFTGTHWQIIAL